MDKKIEVTYSLPYRHYVTIGIVASDLESGIQRVRQAFFDGSLWGDASMPILDDDYAEDGAAGEALTLEGTEVEEFNLRPSVLAHRRDDLARQACEAIVAAYRRSEGSGGSVEWEDIDAAHELALQVCDASDTATVGACGTETQMIKKGDQVRIRPEWQDKGDDLFSWVALEDEDGGRVRIAPVGTGLAFPPVQVVETSMLERE